MFFGLSQIFLMPFGVNNGRLFLENYDTIEHVTWWGRWVGKLIKRWDMDTWEHLEIELEVLLWICFSWRIVFWVFEEVVLVLKFNYSQNPQLTEIETMSTGGSRLPLQAAMLGCPTRRTWDSGRRGRGWPRNGIGSIWCRETPEKAIGKLIGLGVMESSQAWFGSIANYWGINGSECFFIKKSRLENKLIFKPNSKEAKALQ